MPRRRENPIVLVLAAEAVCLAREPDRLQAVRHFIEHAGGRSCLRAVHDHFVYRLHKSSFDFDATLGLKLDISALQHAPWERRTSPWEPAP